MSTRRTHIWIGSELSWLRKNYLEHTDAEIATRFGVTVPAVYHCRLRQGLKRPHVVPPERFQRMQAAKARLDEERRGKPYLKHFRWHSKSKKGTREAWHVMHRHADGRMQEMTLARHVWVSAGRDVPKGLFVVQMSGDPAAPLLEELKLMDRRELGRHGASRVQADRAAARRKAVETMRQNTRVRAFTEHRPYEFQR